MAHHNINVHLVLIVCGHVGSMSCIKLSRIVCGRHAMTEARVHRGVGVGKGQLVSPIRLEHDRKKKNDRQTTRKMKIGHKNCKINAQKCHSDRLKYLFAAGWVNASHQ